MAAPTNQQAHRLNKFLKANPTHENPTNNLSSILFVCDQLICYSSMPQVLRNLLPGYNAFKKLGIEFSNINNNRQDSSPSRATLMTSHINVGIGDNIDQSFQYETVPNLDDQLDTFGKTMKRNGITTAYYGKSHINSNIATDVNITPSFNTNSRACFKQYGFDVFNTFGDTYYYSNMGYFSDDMMIEFKVNNSAPDVDYRDSNGDKYVGFMPYLKARAADKRKFHVQCHIQNPHDTQHCWQNLGQVPAKSQMQYWVPT